MSVLFALRAIGPAPAAAHLAISNRTLHQLVSRADLVIRARPIRQEIMVIEKNGTSSKREVWRVEVLAVLKGPAVASEDLRFAQHGHGVAPLEAGQEVLLFLRDLARSRELRGLRSSALRWYSDQEHDDHYALDGPSRKDLLDATRRYLRIERLPRDQRATALRRTTIDLLASPVPRVAESALQDVVRAGTPSPMISTTDVPGLLRLVRKPGAAIGVRVGVLHVLERDGWVDGDSVWAELLTTTTGDERLVVIRAVTDHPTPQVTAGLLEILRSEDVPAAAAAALAIGTPKRVAAEKPLSIALRSDEQRLAMAAVRALGRVGTDGAREALEEAARAHPNASVRRRAQAELRMLAAR